MNSVSKILPKTVITLLALILSAKTISTVLYIYLPSSGVEPSKHYSYAPEYIRVDFSRLLGIEKYKTTTRSSQRTNTHTNVTSMGDLLLKGLYGNDRYGFAVVAKRSDKDKTTIVSVGEVYDGYKLISIALEHIVFEKNGKKFRLDLEKVNGLQKMVKSAKEKKQGASQRAHTVSRSDISYFSSHPKEIWKNISIKELKRNNRLEGFQVAWVRQNSKFSELGLKKKDIIIKVNNKRLKSYKDALDIYSKISKIKELSVVVLRQGEEKELIYEIN